MHASDPTVNVTDNVADLFPLNEPLVLMSPIIDKELPTLADPPIEILSEASIHDPMEISSPMSTSPATLTLAPITACEPTDMVSDIWHVRPMDIDDRQRPSATTSHVQFSQVAPRIDVIPPSTIDFGAVEISPMNCVIMETDKLDPTVWLQDPEIEAPILAGPVRDDEPETTHDPPVLISEAASNLRFTLRQPPSTPAPTVLIVAPTSIDPNDDKDSPAIICRRAEILPSIIESVKTLKPVPPLILPDTDNEPLM
jgi:hypothetical protein